VTWRWLVFSLMCGLALNVQASDQIRELEYAQDLASKVSTGRLLWLAAKPHDFLTLWTEAEKTDNTNAAILLHDMGQHPDQAPLIQGLRTVLPQHGWATLSLQMPLREREASALDYYGLFDEAQARIHAAVEFLRQQGAQNIALVGYGMGAAMACYSLSQKSAGIFGWVAISLPWPDSSLPQAQVGDWMQQIALPFLDLYAEFDLPAVVDKARQRRMLAKDNPVYRQVMINGETHGFDHDPDLVIKRVYSWLALNLSP